VASFHPHLYEAALELLIAARENAGLSQADLAARFGLTERLVSSYESRSRMLDPAEYIALCRAIGVDPYRTLRDAERAVGSDADG
jgi:transcriptional regulator with XRE-family HTH domain